MQAAAKTLADADDHEDDDEVPISGPIAVEVELDGQDYSFDDWQGDKVLLEFLEEKGLDAPFSCREGNCSACACFVLEGEVNLKRNEVLEAEDLADGHPPGLPVTAGQREAADHLQRLAMSSRRPHGLPCRDH